MALRHGSGEKTWDKIRESPLAGLYVLELYWLAETVRRLCERVFNDAPPPDVGTSYIKVDPDLHATLLALLNAMARIRALLCQRDRRKGQSQEQHAVQVKRIKWLRNELLANVHLDLLLQAKVRHTLEHFDEYLDETALQLVKGVKKTTYLPVDMALGSRDTIKVISTADHAEIPLRVYCARERIYMNAGHSIELTAVHAEAKAVAEQLSGKLPDFARNDRGGQMVVITPETFGRHTAPGPQERENPPSSGSDTGRESGQI